MRCFLKEMGRALLSRGLYLFGWFLVFLAVAMSRVFVLLHVPPAMASILSGVVFGIPLYYLWQILVCMNGYPMTKQAWRERIVFGLAMGLTMAAVSFWAG